MKESDSDAQTLSKCDNICARHVGMYSEQGQRICPQRQKIHLPRFIFSVQPGVLCIPIQFIVEAVGPGMPVRCAEVLFVRVRLSE